MPIRPTCTVARTFQNAHAQTIAQVSFDADAPWVARLVERALRSKSRKATAAGGAIRVTIITTGKSVCEGST